MNVNVVVRGRRHAGSTPMEDDDGVVPALHGPFRARVPHFALSEGTYREILSTVGRPFKEFVIEKLIKRELRGAINGANVCIRFE